MTKRRILYDVTLRRPACVLLQAAARCDIAVAHLFPAQTWLVAPTKDMKVYEVTEEELRKLVVITEAYAMAKEKDE